LTKAPLDLEAVRPRERDVDAAIPPEHTRRERARRAARLLLVLMFVGMGVAHFVALEHFVGIMPTYLPWHTELVLLTGVLEILGGVGLLHARTRRAAGLGLVLLLIAVLPANVHELTASASPVHPAAWLRLPLQLVFVAWVWWVAQEAPRS
jgi:uncharacterized membrane protein